MSDARVDRDCDCPYCEGVEGYRLASTPLPANTAIVPIHLIHYDREAKESRYVLPPGAPDPVTGERT